jgi:hypothetical protein
LSIPFPNFNISCFIYSSHLISLLRGYVLILRYSVYQYSHNKQKLIYSSCTTSQRLQQRYFEQGNFYFLKYTCMIVTMKKKIHGQNTNTHWSRL